jgi:eukaryotic-like serine/threonine-protein kinase
MAQHVANIPDFLSVLTRSQLLPGDTIQIIGRGWKGDANDVDGLRKLLVNGKHLTEYQAAMLQRGHVDGFHIGGYVIQERIGKGQMAGVYLGKHGSGQHVAIKVLPGSKSRNATILARFQREGRLLTQLNHPNIVRAFQIGQVKDAHFIAMEHLDGESLDEMLTRRKRLPLAEASRLTVQLLEGLQHLAGHRMIHRDIKPANIMLVGGTKESTAQATIKLVDIGLGREFFNESNPEINDIALTREGAFLGTPDYLSPEQARDPRSVDIRSDLYSVGCVFYHLITGRPPFQGSNVMEQIIQHATEHAPRLSQLLPDAPPNLQIVIDRLLAKDPNDRFPQPDEAAQVLTFYLPQSNTQAQATSILPAYSEWLMAEAKKDTAVPISTEKVKAGKEIDQDRFHVEVVTMPDSQTESSDENPIERGSSRGWFDLDRRDWVMMAVGFVLSCAAIGAGYGLSQWLRGISAS